MANVVSRRIYDFMKEYPPFDLLPSEVLTRIAERVLVQYRRSGEVIFRAGDQPGTYIYMVRDGAVHLYQGDDDHEALVDECDEGDVFGIRPLLAEDTYALTARAAEETLVYAINIEGFRELMVTNPQLSYYLATNMAAGIRQTKPGLQRPQLFLEQGPHGMDAYRLLETQSIERSKAPVTCSPDTTVQAAARLMTEHRVGSIIITDEVQHPLGIVTDRDLRQRIATGEHPLSAPVAAIMASPVVTVPPAMTVANVQIAMLRGQIHHLCVTADGTVNAPVVGVVSEHDLLVLQGNNPAVIIREIARCTESAQLRALRERAEHLLEQYIYREVDIAYIATIMTEINDEIIRRCIILSQDELKAAGLPAPLANFCWLALGSEGRSEQLLRTDQDNALIFEDVHLDEYADTKNYYLQLSQAVTDKLNTVGFDYCPGDMMASNPRWCLSLEKWKTQFSEWIFEPSPEAVMHTSIFFDYRPVYGDDQLAAALTEHIFEALNEQTIFLSFLAKDSLKNPPPLTFFRNFVVESSGEHKDEFDIKKRAMMPLTDAARVLILHARVGKINNTFRRFEKLAEIDENNRELFQQAAEAYEILMRLRTLQGFRKEGTGRYFKPSELSKMERIHLRNSFQPVKDLQALLTVRFQLGYIR